MNTRSNVFEFNCEEHQVNEIVSALIHSIFFYRTYGKFNYSSNGTFSIGSIGYEEVFCDYIDFTYVRCNSSSLIDNLAKSIKEFSLKLKQKKIKKGVITLEFYSKKAKILPMLSFTDNNLIWEQWIIKINCDSKESNNENLTDLLLEKLMFIINLANNHKLYIPEMPTENLLDGCFNCTHPDVLPYLYRITSKFVEDDTSTGSYNSDGTLTQFFKEMIK